MTHKPRLHALRACIAETLFTLSDWLFDAGYRVKPPALPCDVTPITLDTIRAMVGDSAYWDEVRASISEGKDT